MYMLFSIWQFLVLVLVVPWPVLSISGYMLSQLLIVFANCHFLWWGPSDYQISCSLCLVHE